MTTSTNPRAQKSLRQLTLAVFSVVSLLIPALTVQAKSSKQFSVTIDNFGQIKDHYYRGAQPDEEEFGQLKRLGVKTIIDLRNDRKSKSEKWAQQAGLQYINIPLSDRRAATDAQTAYFLQLANDRNNWPIYVHCAGGRHRTGEMTAIYRITQDGWSADQAYQEMKQFDWYSRWGHKPLKEYVFDYYQRYKTNGTMTAQTQTATNSQ